MNDYLIQMYNNLYISNKTMLYWSNVLGLRYVFFYSPDRSEMICRKNRNSIFYPFY